MNKNKDKKIILLVFLVAIFALGNNSGMKDGRNNVLQQPFEVKNSYVVSQFIIDDDISNGAGDYTWAEAVLEPWCSGSGTELDPYIINDITVDGGGVGSCITIRDSEVYIRIENCTVYNSEGYLNAGIKLSYVENGIIENNYCSYNNRGIKIEESSSIIVSNNTLYENGFGIEISSSNITILKNDCSKSYQAIHIYISSDCILNENVCRDSEFGIHLYLSSRITLLENVMENCGIVCVGSKTAVSSHNIDETNIVNGKPVRYYSSQTGIYVPSNTGQIIMANCSLSTIENQNINYATDAIEILFCTNITITGNNCSFNTKNGIFLDHSYNNTIYANNCSNNGDGIDITYSEENLVSENNCIDNRDGIYLYGSDNNTVKQNTCMKNEDGIYLHYSDNIIIESNFIGSNEIGLYLAYSNYNFITNNTFNRNQEDIVEAGSNGNEFSGNTYIHDVFDNTLILTVVIVAIVGVAGVTAAVTFKKKKRVSVAKKSKEAVKKSRIEEVLYDRLSNVDRLIREDKVEEALKNLEVIRDVSKEQGLYNITIQCEKKLREYEKELEKVKYEKKLEKVKFTAGYPGCINPGTWLSLVIFLHIPSLQEEVQKKIKKEMEEGRMGFHPAPAELDLGIKAERGTRFKFIPRVKGFRFNPQSQEVVWYEDYHEIEFRLCTEEDFEEQFTTGCVDVYKEGFLIAQIPLSIKIGDYEEETTYSETKMFEKVFISYAHLDENVVDYAVKFYNALRIEVLRDKDKLRTADDWEKELMHMIDIADVFQLFWSNASKDSSYVENEWKHAIEYEGLKGVYFIRSFYWEMPMPQPPEELKHLHFHKLDLDPSLFEKQFIP